ncbi:hypothetical protein AAMO2058_001589900 [Amorphochlora amoebiformis]
MSDAKKWFDLTADVDTSKSGELIFAGGSAWSLSGRSGETAQFDGQEERNLVSFHRLKPLIGVPVFAVVTGCVANHTFALTEKGIFAWGRNENGELGLGDQVNRYNPTLVTKISNLSDPIVGGACGDKHTLLYSKLGILYTCGDNEFGQLGNGHSGNTTINISPLSIISGVRTAGAGRGFSCVADKAGSCYTFGYPKDGILGHGTEGKFLGTGNKWEYACETRPRKLEALTGVKIAQVSCGARHTIAADEHGRVYTWGFGGYGRLGHGDNKNQFLVKALEFFHNEPEKPPPNANPLFFRPKKPRRLKHVAAGSRCCYGIDEYGRLYFWGITKSSGEATMYPKPYNGLQGWNVRSVASGFSSTIVASDSLITWGPSPTSGELGYGEKGPKSSTIEKIVEDLEDAYVLKVGMGYRHSLAIVELADGGDKLVEKLPVFEPLELKDMPKREASSKKSSKKRKREEDDDEEEEDEDEDEDEEEKEEEDITKLTVKALKQRLKDHGLKISGNKPKLVARLKSHMKKKAKK